MNKLLIFIVSMVMSSCVTNGSFFPSDLSWITNEKTTQADVKSMLGDPHSVGSSGGTKTWTYGYYAYKLIGKSYTKELKFYWQPDKVLKTYSFTSSFPEDINNPP